MAKAQRIYLCDRLALDLPEKTEYRAIDGTITQVDTPSMVLSGMKKPKLRITVPASHSGRLTNRRVYPGVKMKDSTNTWTDGYPRPFLSRHPGGMGIVDTPEPNVLGRIVNAEYKHITHDEEWLNDFTNPTADSGSGYVEVTAEITDRDAIEKFLDGRMSTVSVGFFTDSLTCSICTKDMKVEICDHRPGKVYTAEGKDAEEGEGKLCFLVTGNMEYDHLADVNTPADKFAVISSTQLIDSAIIEDRFTEESKSIPKFKLNKLVLIDEEDPSNNSLLLESSGGKANMADENKKLKALEDEKATLEDSLAKKEDALKAVSADLDEAKKTIEGLNKAVEKALEDNKSQVVSRIVDLHVRSELIEKDDVEKTKEKYAARGLDSLRDSLADLEELVKNMKPAGGHVDRDAHLSDSAKKDEDGNDIVEEEVPAQKSLSSLFKSKK